MLLYVQPQHQHVDISSPTCLDQFAVGTHTLYYGAYVFPLLHCYFAMFTSFLKEFGSLICVILLDGVKSCSERLAHIDSHAVEKDCQQK